MTQEGKLGKITGWTSLAFGIYCFAMAIAVVVLELVYFSILFALIFSVMGAMYAIAGISLLRKGRYGFVLFFGFFGSTFWWSPGIDYYYLPMIIMPIVIIIMMAVLLLRRLYGTGL